MNSVNLVPIDIEISEFGETFDPSKLDYANGEKEKHRESVLKVLQKCRFNSNLCKNADGLFATKTHDKSHFYGLEVVEYLGEFALSYQVFDKQFN